MNDKKEIPVEQEEARNFIINGLRNGRYKDDRYDLCFYNKMICDINKQYKLGIVYIGLRDLSKDNQFLKFIRPFYDAAWELCRVGILRPGIIHFTGNNNTYEETWMSTSYFLTEAGKKWLEEGAKIPIILKSPSELANILDTHKQRFGDGFHERSQEAIKCYENNLFLSCCVMCGAAVESIILKLAIEIEGNQDQVEKKYEPSNGFLVIKKIVLDQLNNNLSSKFDQKTAQKSYDKFEEDLENF